MIVICCDNVLVTEVMLLFLLVYTKMSLIEKGVDNVKSWSIITFMTCHRVSVVFLEQVMAENEYLDSTKARRWLSVDNLSQLDEGHLPLIVARHLRTTNLLQHGEPIRPYVDLFHRYKTEWHNLIEQARRNGCDWVRRIDLPGQAA